MAAPVMGGDVGADDCELGVKETGPAQLVHKPGHGSQFSVCCANDKGFQVLINDSFQLTQNAL